MIQYALPDFTVRLPFNLMFIRMMKSAPEIFFDNIRISSLYGCFPGCFMNGGRVMNGERFNYNQINETFDIIEKEGLGIRLTFTNMFLKPEHFEDSYANTILRAAQKRNAKVIVWSDELGDYITSRYHLGLILSTSRELDGVDELNRMLESYDMVVLDYNHNKDDVFLKQVMYPSKLEVMANEVCRPGCPTRRLHYEDESRCQLENIPSSFRCPDIYEGAGFTTRTASSPTILGNDDIQRLNETYGISHFKIVGRNTSVGMYAEAYLYYLVRPMYRGVVEKIIRRYQMRGEI